MWRVRMRSAAKRDIGKTYDWYERQRLGLGDEFLETTAETFLRLEQLPNQFPLYYRGFRRALTKRFPYKVFFQITGDTVVVFRVLHAARDHTWQLK